MRTVSRDNVEHHPEQQRFVIATPQGEARLEYRLINGTGEGATVDFTYTYVPPSLRGQGLAEALVRQGLAWARQQEFQVRASCWYVAKFLR